MKLNIKAFGLACGIICGLAVFTMTWWIMLFEGSTGELVFIGHIYRGYCVSPLGSVIGLVWGFFDGLIGGVIFAWLYNLLAGKGAESAQN